MGRNLMSPCQRELQRRIATACRDFRIEIGYTQAQVAEEVKTSPQDISAFETCRNNSATIYHWYIQKGVKID